MIMIIIIVTGVARMALLFAMIMMMFDDKQRAYFAKFVC